MQHKQVAMSERMLQNRKTYSFEDIERHKSVQVLIDIVDKNRGLTGSTAVVNHVPFIFQTRYDL